MRNARQTATSRLHHPAAATTTRCDVLIIGAGLTGLSTAYHLQEAGVTDYVIMEAESRPGGWAKTDWTGPYGADRAIHVLYFRDSDLLRWTEDLLDGQWRSHSKRCLIDSGGIRTPFPFHANLYGRPAAVVGECLSGLWQASVARERSPQSPVTFADWIDLNYGAGVRRHFMEPFNSKMWTVPTAEIGCDWIADFIPAVAPSRIVAGALAVCDSRIGLNATFNYPLRGISQLSEALAARLKASQVWYDTSIIDVDPDASAATMSDGRRVRYRWLVSTMPLPRLATILRRLPISRSDVQQLESLDLLLVDVGFERPPEVQDVHWVYLPDPEVLAYRLHLCHVLSEELAPPGQGLYCLEISHSRHRPLPCGNVRPRVISDLIRTAWLRSERQVTFYRERRFPCAYVLPRVGFRAKASEMTRALVNWRILSVGRYGTWKHASMEDALRDGRTTAHAIASAPGARTELLRAIEGA